MKKILIILLSFMILTGCSSDKNSNYESYHNEDNNYVSNNADYGLENDLNELISYQKEMDKKVKSFSENQTITFDNMYVIPNPYKLSHLSALVIFYTQNKESVKLYIEDEMIFELEESNKHVIPIYGLYSEKNNKVTIELGSGTTKNIYIKTDKVIGNDLIVETTKLSNSEFFYSSSSNSDENVIYDSKGKVRWYMNGNLNKDLLVLSNGHMLISNGVSRDEIRKDIPTGLIEVDYLGKIYNQFLIPNGVHHELREISPNRVIVCSFAEGDVSRNDIIYIVNLSTGKIEKTIDLFEVVKSVSLDYAEEIKNDEDWTHINSVAIDEQKDLLYVSFRGMNSIMSIKLSGLTINYIFTNTPKSWNNSFKKYIISIDSNDYIMGQHSLSIVDGNISLFNNNANMDYRTAEFGKFHGYSYPVIYKINNGKVSVVYKYSSDTKYYSKSHGSFTFDERDYKLINYSMTENKEDESQYKYMIIMELDNKDKVIFKARKENDSTYSFYKNDMYKTTNYYSLEDYNLVEVK